MTRDIGFLLSSFLKPGDIILLEGAIGTGKTTFVQGIASGLEVPGEIAVTSPSFTLVNRYPGRIAVFHADFYRLSDSDHFGDLELEEIAGGDGVFIVEWPQVAVHQFPHRDILVRFTWDLNSLTERTIRFQWESDRFGSFLKLLERYDRSGH